MSSDRDAPARTGYDCEQVGDTFSLFDGDVRLVAEGARWVGSAEIKATIRIFKGDLPIESVVLNLNSRSTRRRLLKDLKADKDFALADSALVTLENFIRGRLPRPGRDNGAAPPSDGLEHSNTSAEVQLSEEAQALLTDPNLLEHITNGIR